VHGAIAAVDRTDPELVEHVEHVDLEIGLLVQARPAEIDPRVEVHQRISRRLVREDLVGRATRDQLDRLVGVVDVARTRALHVDAQRNRRQIDRRAATEGVDRCVRFALARGRSVDDRAGGGASHLDIVQDLRVEVRAKGIEADFAHRLIGDRTVEAVLTHGAEVAIHRTVQLGIIG
ncbi:hypothetical protein QU38_02390, partial [Staphylococcus aureus]